MIKEAYVSLEVAKLLKEKGFDEPCRTYYEENKLINDVCVKYYQWNSKSPFDFISAPTQQMAMKWLRKVHKIAIVISCRFGGERYINWHGTIICYGDNLKTQQDVELPYVATYEEAVETALKYTLENLI